MSLCTVSVHELGTNIDVTVDLKYSLAKFLTGTVLQVAPFYCSQEGENQVLHHANQKCILSLHDFLCTVSIHKPGTNIDVTVDKTTAVGTRTIGLMSIETKVDCSLLKVVC